MDTGLLLLALFLFVLIAVHILVSEHFVIIFRPILKAITMFSAFLLKMGIACTESQMEGHY